MRRWRAVPVGLILGLALGPVLSLVLGLGLGLGEAAAQEPSVPAAQQGPSIPAIARNCMGCHGEDGISPGAVPTIAGKKADWIAKTLKEFRSGKRKSTIMGRIIKPFGDEDIAGLAAYFARK